MNGRLDGRSQGAKVPAASHSGRTEVRWCRSAATGPTPSGIRIGPVYAPTKLRGHGYATTLTADVSAAQLVRGRRFCILYTDLANPTSNAIYERIGYVRVCESKQIGF
jgi:predicted GNAT family acetyltransferase